MNQKFLKSKTVPVLFVLALFFAIYLYQNKHADSESPGQNTQSLQQEQEATDSDHAEQKQAQDKSRPESNDTSELPSEIRDYSYEKQKETILEAAQDLPDSKEQLLSLIVKEDYFKANNVEVKPHTRFERIQNQMGAAKVIALRSLLANQQDTNLIRQDLNFVIEKAQDPTIVKIAEAARDSLSKGRSFFDDFLEGIAQMPL